MLSRTSEYVLRAMAFMAQHVDEWPLPGPRIAEQRIVLDGLRGEDSIAVNGNPLEDVTLLQDVRVVIKGGTAST